MNEFYKRTHNLPDVVYLNDIGEPARRTASDIYSMSLDGMGIGPLDIFGGIIGGATGVSSVIAAQQNAKAQADLIKAQQQMQREQEAADSQLWSNVITFGGYALAALAIGYVGYSLLKNRKVK